MQMYVGSQKELKAFDQYLLDHGYTIEQLIDKASDCLLPHFVDYSHVAIMVGPGNNGADGLSLALKLHEKHIDVDIFYIGDPERFSPGNQFYFNRCEEEDLQMILVDDDVLSHLTERINDYDVIADAFFGFGLNSAPRGLYKSVIDLINRYYCNDVIAIDIPTGLSCNSAHPYASVLFATSTICLTALKAGYLDPESLMVTGHVYVEELAIDNPFEEAGLYKLYELEDAKATLKKRAYNGYKKTYGVDLLIAGSHHYRGAPILAAKGCALSGAGIVKVLSDPAVTQLLPAILPEAIVIDRPERLNEDLLKGHNAIMIGPGLGLDEQAENYLLDVFHNSDAPLVIDADGLTILSKHLDLLKGDRTIVLTPHIGEFKRLLHSDEIDDVMEAAKDFAKKYHVIMVAKGPNTIVTDGTKNVRIHSGSPAMAVGGMGDTLAGIITAFLGMHYKPIDAVMLAVYLHSYVGEKLAKKAYTVMPEEVSKHMPEVMAELVNEDLK